jgi:hypothetical protein
MLFSPWRYAMPKTDVEKGLEDKAVSNVAVRLTGYADYHHLESDERKHDGDVVEVEEGRARALIQQGYAEPAEDAKRN